VQRHSADIDIESEPGCGTTARLSFALPATAARDPEQVFTVPRMRASLNLLIVDDDPILLKSLEDILAGDGHPVTVAHGGQAGVDAVRTALEQGHPFDLVFTDLGMPHVDGRKVASAVKALVPSMPVVLLTGWGQRLMAEDDIPLHVDRVLSKPPKPRDLREALAALIPEGAVR
jgi:CheY-like chemotaxis protein